MRYPPSFRSTRFPGLLVAFLLAALAGMPARAAQPAQPAHAAPAQPAPTGQPVPALTPAEAQQLLSVLNDPAKRAEVTTTLDNLVKAAGAKPPAAAPAGLAPNSLGAELLVGLDRAGSDLATQAADFGRTFHSVRYAGWWFRSILDDPDRRTEVAQALLRLALVLGVALAVGFALNKLIRRPISALARVAGGRPPPAPPVEPEPIGTAEAEPPDAAQLAPAAEQRARRRHDRNFARMLHALRRIPFAIAHFALELVPITAFALVAFLFELSGIVRIGEGLVVVQSVINAVVVGGVLAALTFTLFAPGRPTLRLILFRDEAAERVSFWFWLMIVVGAWGFAALHAVESFGLPAYAVSALAKLLVFIEHTLLAVLILRSRRDVAERLRPPRRVHGGLRQLLRMAADHWWIIAIFFDYAFWLIWAAELRNGYARLWTVALETAVVAVLARLLAIALLGALERSFRVKPEVAAQYPWYARRAERYYPVIRRLAVTVVLAISAIVLLQLWGLDAFTWFRSGALGSRLVSALIGVVTALVVAAVAWEAANAGLERYVDRLASEQGQSGGRVARARTLMPILRITLFIFIATVLVLTILSEIGVNIAPLLGGAGIIGVAIGFGSQKLVQDFITGIFLLLENTMQVGDWVTLGGLSGSVEQLSIRTIRLRAGDGSLHIIPFSSVTTVTNTNRGIGNAAISVDVAPEEDTDRVGDVLKEIAAGMRADPAFRDGMLNDLQFWGVDKVTTQAVTLVGQIPCTDRARYGVQREFNRRLKKRFEELGIRLAEPSHIVRLVRGPEAGCGRAHAGCRCGGCRDGSIR